MATRKRPAVTPQKATPKTQTTGNTTGTKGAPMVASGVGKAAPGGRGVGTSVTPSDVFPSAGNKPTPPSMPKPMVASGVGKAAPGGRGVGTSVTPSDVFPSAGNKPTPPSMPKPMVASGVGRAAPVAPKRTPMMGSGVGKAAATMKKGGMAKMKKDEMPSKMGKVKTSSKADGVATKGKTKGKMIAMAAGGMKGYKKGGMSCK